jgi:hypothetical protein
MKKKINNPVAKHARTFNKATVMTDRKKAMKKGDRKHKGKYEDAQQTDTSGHTNAAAKKPQNYTDKDGKQKTRMVPAHQDVQNEALNPSMGIKAYIDDFQKSDAPQFQGKSAKKRREMAIAAYMDAKNEAFDRSKYKAAAIKDREAATDTYAKTGAASQRARIVKRNKGLARIKEDAEARARLKLKHAKEKENMKNRHTKEREAMKEEDVKENYRASRALSHAANKMYGRQHPEQDKPKTGVAKKAKKPSSKADIFRALDKKYGSPKNKTGIYAKEEVDEAKDYHAEIRRQKNIADKQRGKMSKATSHADMVAAMNRHMKAKKNQKSLTRAQAHKEEVEHLDESQKLANKKAELRKKMFGDANYLSPAQRKELDKAAKAELKKDSAKKRAAPKPAVTTKTAKGKTHTGRSDPADQNIFMQMRKAQDAAKNSGAKMHTLRVGPKSSVSVPTSLVNKALAKHDSLKKPEDKRKLKIQLIKALRAKAK